MAYAVGSATDKGMRRAANEDSLLAPVGVPAPDGSDCLFFAVADGVGGAVGGAVASSTAIERLRDAFCEPAFSSMAERLRNAVKEANAAVSARAAADAGLRGMATTLVAAAVIAHRIWFANVGDSRGYLLQDGELYQVTLDHSLVADAVRAGFIAPEDASGRPERHVINRSLGSADSVEVDCFGPLRFSPGDVALLCSDGVHDVIDEDRLPDILSQSPPADAALALVRAANEAGGPDNITVVVVGAE